MVTAHFCPVYIALFLVPTKSLSLAFGLQENIFVAISLYQRVAIFWHFLAKILSLNSFNLYTDLGSPAFNFKMFISQDTEICEA